MELGCTMITNDELEIAKILIYSGVGINDIDNDQRTALTNAVRNKNVKLVKLLLENGASDKIDYFDPAGLSLIELSALFGNLEIVKTVINYCDYDKDSDILCRVVGTKNIDMAEFLLDLGFNVNCRNIVLQTPLSIAVESGCIEMTHLLLDYGAEVNTQDKFGYTPLMRACLRSTEITELLLENGADTSYVNDERETVVSMIVYKPYMLDIMLPYIVTQMYKSTNGGHNINSELINKHGYLLNNKLEYEAEIQRMKSIKLTPKYSLDVFLLHDDVRLLSREEQVC